MGRLGVVQTTIEIVLSVDIARHVADWAVSHAAQIANMEPFVLVVVVVVNVRGTKRVVGVSRVVRAANHQETTRIGNGGRGRMASSSRQVCPELASCH